MNLRKKSRDLGGTEVACRSQRMDTGTPQRFVGIDVPDTGKPALVEQGRLDRGAATGEVLGETLRREGPRKRLPSHTPAEVRAEVFLFDELPGSKPADVPVHDVRPVV